MGDFYETFDEDAGIAAAVLGIALTSRPMGGGEARVPLAGIPYHALDRYLERLVAAGHRVAIVEQTSPPGRGLVERRVVRVVTPGTVDEGALVPERGHNWLVALAPADPAQGADAAWGLAACDVTTGELECQLVAASQLPGEWARLRPREVLVPEGLREGAIPPELAGVPLLRTPRPPREFLERRAEELLCSRFGVTSLGGFGLEGMGAAVSAAGALLRYLEEAWPAAVRHLRPPRAVRAQDHVYLDPQTRRNLELFSGGREGDASLVETLDRTLTPMGGRLLRARLGRPLRRVAAIEARLDEVEACVRAPLARAALRRGLHGLPDLDRLLGRVRSGQATARHLVQLRLGLERLPGLRAAAIEAGPAAAALAEQVLGAGDAAAPVALALADDPPADPADGGTVRAGFDPEIDALRRLAGDAREALAELEAAERQRSGIGPLKVGYHRVFGYYLEVPRAQAGRVPADYEPRQTLAQAQRFRCPALGELESRILDARERLLDAERVVLERVRAQVAAAGLGIERAAEAVAQLDVAAALAEVAAERQYVRPELAEGGALSIEAGRHPVVERRLPSGEFVPNDCALGGDAADIVVLTGPNMGGKSTYLRQVALTVLLAQCGAFVPAARARVPVVDRIYSRVGAQDDIAAGASTFMVEMLETAAILHNATEQSLVILDEIGRGTATWDGLAIARAVLEYLHHRPGGTPRTLFATHYHELTALAGVLPRVTNRSVAVREEHGAVVLLHRIVDGGADRSYGVHVAALAGMPRVVVARARELLADLERRPAGVEPIDAAAGSPGGASGSADERQLSLLGQPGALAGLVEVLADLDPDALTPLEALQRLYELRGDARRRLGREG